MSNGKASSSGRNRARLAALIPGLEDWVRQQMLTDLDEFFDGFNPAECGKLMELLAETKNLKTKPLRALDLEKSESSVCPTKTFPRSGKCPVFAERADQDAGHCPWTLTESTARDADGSRIVQWSLQITDDWLSPDDIEMNFESANRSLELKAHYKRSGTIDAVRDRASSDGSEPVSATYSIAGIVSVRIVLPSDVDENELVANISEDRSMLRVTVPRIEKHQGEMDRVKTDANSMMPIQIRRK